MVKVGDFVIPTSAYTMLNHPGVHRIRKINLTETWEFVEDRFKHSAGVYIDDKNTCYNLAMHFTIIELTDLEKILYSIYA